MDALGLETASVWGSSMGGIVALHLLARHPERIDGLVVTGAHGDRVSVPDDDPLAPTLRAEGIAPFLRMPEAPDWMADTMRRADPLALAALAEALPRRPGVLPLLAAIDTPVLLLAGADDDALPAIRRTAELLPRGTLVILPGCSHFGAFVRSDLSLPAAVRHLAAP